MQSNFFSFAALPVPPFSKKTNGETSYKQLYQEGMAHCRIAQNAKLSFGFFDAGQTVNYAFNPVNKCLFVFVISGTILINGTTLLQRDAIGIWNTNAIEITCTHTTEFLIIETPVNQK